MAEGKNKIIVYADWIEIFEPLSEEEAGRLIKHFFQYVNDKNPIAPDRLTELIFSGSIKPTLKRDLKKWEETAGKRSDAGKISAEKRKQQESTKPTSVESVEQKPTKPTVKVNVKVNVIDKDKEKEIISRLSPIHLASFFSWLEYRKSLKKAINIEATLVALVNKFNSFSNDKVKWVVDHSIENGYVGLFWDKYQSNNNQTSKNPKG